MISLKGRVELKWAARHTRDLRKGTHCSEAYKA